jgi:hypothetical protein
MLPSTHAPLALLSNLLSISRVVIDSGLRGDQTNKITGLVRDSSTALAAKFSVVISYFEAIALVAWAGLVSELKSTARPKLGGKLIIKSLH